MPELKKASDGDKVYCNPCSGTKGYAVFHEEPEQVDRANGLVKHTPTPWRVVGSVWRSRDKASIRLRGTESEIDLTITGTCRNPEELARFRADVHLILYAVNRLTQMRAAVNRIRAIYDQLRTDYKL